MNQIIHIKNGIKNVLLVIKEEMKIIIIASCTNDQLGNYLYHFIYNQPGQCFSIDIKQDNEY